MLFNSLDFLIFFPIVVLIYFLLAHKYRWAFLLLASYYFAFSWKAESVIIIIAATIVNYVASRWIAQKRSKIVLAAALVFNIALLFAFKYWNFFTDTTRGALQHMSI